MVDGYLSQPENSFHSIDSEASMIKQNEGMDVEEASHVNSVSSTSSAKRRKQCKEDDSTSSSLKRGMA